MPDYGTQQISFQNANRLTDPFKVSVKQTINSVFSCEKMRMTESHSQRKKCTASIYEFKYMFSVKKRKSSNIKLEQKITSV